MSERIVIASRLRKYAVSFVDDLSSSLGQRMEGRFFVMDEKVIELHKPRVTELLASDRIVPVQVKESCKTIEYCTRVLECLMEKNIQKRNALVVIGGGVVQDVGAFIASILFRGVEWELYPTTLLSQADSCIGGKSSLNFGKYKNMLGSFYPPSEIFIDVGFLETLPEAEIKSGIGEMLHFYLIDGCRMVEELVENYDELLRDRRQLKIYIEKSLEIKRKVIERDEFDMGERRIFSYGHTFGHAIESISGYTVNHGQAVTMGMDIANFVSHVYGRLEFEVLVKLRKILSRNMPAFRLKRDQLDEYCQALLRDKKSIGGEVGVVLTRGPGCMEQAQFSMDSKFRKTIMEYFEHHALG